MAHQRCSRWPRWRPWWRCWCRWGTRCTLPGCCLPARTCPGRTCGSLGPQCQRDTSGCCRLGTGQVGRGGLRGWRNGGMRAGHARDVNTPIASPPRGHQTPQPQLLSLPEPRARPSLLPLSKHITRLARCMDPFFTHRCSRWSRWRPRWRCWCRLGSQCRRPGCCSPARTSPWDNNHSMGRPPCPRGTLQRGGEESKEARLCKLDCRVFGG